MKKLVLSMAFIFFVFSILIYAPSYSQNYCELLTLRIKFVCDGEPMRGIMVNGVGYRTDEGSVGGLFSCYDGDDSPRTNAQGIVVLGTSYPWKGGIRLIYGRYGEDILSLKDFEKRSNSDIISGQTVIIETCDL